MHEHDASKLHKTGFGEFRLKHIIIIWAQGDIGRAMWLRVSGFKYIGWIRVYVFHPHPVMIRRKGCGNYILD